MSDVNYSYFILDTARLGEAALIYNGSDIEQAAGGRPWLRLYADASTRMVGNAILRLARLHTNDPEKRPAQILQEISELEAELAGLKGERFEIWNGRDGQVRSTPRTGATLRVSWAIQDQSYEDWYPTVAAAKAALAEMARAEGRALSPNGWHLDLTAHGCHESGADVTRCGGSR